MGKRPPRHEPPACGCQLFPSAHVWHGKRRSGTLDTTSAPLHMNAGCPHGTLYEQQRVYPARLIERSAKRERQRRRDDAKGYASPGASPLEKIA